MASNLLAMASNILAMASNLVGTASKLIGNGLQPEKHITYLQAANKQSEETTRTEPE